MSDDEKNTQPWIVDVDKITGPIIETAIKIHRELGPGLLESVYDAVLVRALEKQRFWVQSQKAVRFEYDGMIFLDAFRADLVVNGRVIVEVKSAEKVGAIHKKQLLTYLRLMKLPVGLLINFGEATLKQGLHRIVNNLQPSMSQTSCESKASRVILLQSTRERWRPGDIYPYSWFVVSRGDAGSAENVVPPRPPRLRVKQQRSPTNPNTYSTSQEAFGCRFPDIRDERGLC